MSANLFDENKSNKNYDNENLLVQMMNMTEDDNEIDFNNQENLNSLFNNSTVKNINDGLKDKISEIGYSRIQRRGLFGYIYNNESDTFFGNSIDLKKEGLFENSDNNQGASLFLNNRIYITNDEGILTGRKKVNNKKNELFDNNTGNPGSLFGKINNNQGNSLSINNKGNQSRRLFRKRNNNYNKSKRLIESYQFDELFDNILNNKDDNKGISLFENCSNNQGGNLFGNSNSNQSCLGLFDININNNNKDSDSLSSNINEDKSLFGNINNSNNVFNSLFGENDSNDTQRNSLSGNNKSIESGLLGNGNNNQTNIGFLNKDKNNISSNKNNNSLFENYNNSNNSLFSRSIITENSLFGNLTNQEKIKHIFHCNYIQFEDPTLDNNKINIFEDNEKNDNHVNTLAKIMEEIEDDANIDASTINNQEKQNSEFNNSIINIYNELKDKIPDISDGRINNGIELLNEEIIEI